MRRSSTVPLRPDRGAQERDALRPTESAPVGIRLARGLDRLRGVGARAALEIPDDLLGVRGIEVGKRALARLLFRARDEHQVRGTELVAQLIQRGVELAVKIIPERTKAGVRNFFHGGVASRP